MKVNWVYFMTQSNQQLLIARKTRNQIEKKKKFERGMKSDLKQWKNLKTRNWKNDFPSFPLAKLRARMIRHNWQVLRHEMEGKKANELVTLTLARRLTSHSFSLLFRFANYCFNPKALSSHRAAKIKTRPIVSAFQQITDSRHSSKPQSFHTFFLFFFYL